jgi:hypothetical protein
MFYIIFFYCNSMLVCLAVVYEYDDILLILIDIIFLINMKFTGKYY